VGVESSVVVASGALLPEGGLTEIADTDVAEVAAEEIDAAEVGGERDE